MPEVSNHAARGPWFRGNDYSRPASEIDEYTVYASENVQIGNAGQAEKRKGSSPINSSALNSGATVLALGRHPFAAGAKEWAIVGDKFYEAIDGTPLDRTSTMTITAGDDNVYSMVNAGGTLIGHNGVSGDDILKWAASGNIATLDVDSRFTTAEFWEYWDRRAWAAYTNASGATLWFSDAGDIETWGATSFFNIDEDFTGIKKWNTGILLHSANGLSMLMPTGNADTPYRKNDIVLSEDDGGLGGSVSGYAIVNVPYVGQCFPRRDGIYAFTGGHVEKISEKLDGSRYWDDINKDRLSESFVQIYPLRNEVWWWLPNGGSQTNMNQAMVLNYRLTRANGEPVWYGPYVDLTRNCGSLIDDLPAFGGFDGFVYKHGTGTADNDGSSDVAIDAFFETSTTAPMGGGIDMGWKKARVFFEVKGSYEVESREMSPDIAANAETIEMGGSYDAIETSFTIGKSKIAGDDVVEYADIDLSGDSPFKQMRFRNGNVNEEFGIRNVLLGHKPIGGVRRDQAGVH